MKAGSVISYILAAILIIFSFLFLLGAGGEGVLLPGSFMDHRLVLGLC
jgi:hypothetical protein